MLISRKLSLFAFLWVLALGLTRCGDKIVSDSGGGTDIGNPISLTVVDPHSTPVPGARVKLLSSTSWFNNLFEGKALVFDSAVSNSSGVAVFDSITAGSYKIQIDHPIGGAFVSDVYIADSNFSDTIPITKFGSAAGSIFGISSQPLQIRLAGASYKSSVEKDGSYFLQNIPKGNYVTMLMTPDSQWVFGNKIDISSSTVTAYSDSVSLNSLLINDFEMGSALNLATLVKGSFLFSTEASGTAAYQIVPEGFGGVNALKGTLTPLGNYAIVGYFLGIKSDGDSLWNFSEASGLSFYAKGSGKMNVSIESDAIDKMGFIKHYSADIVLPPDWEKVTISLDTLGFFPDINPNPSISWEEAGKSIKRIEFNTVGVDTTEFWIDNLTLEGSVFSTVYSK